MISTERITVRRPTFTWIYGSPDGPDASIYLGLGARPQHGVGDTQRWLLIPHWLWADIVQAPFVVAITDELFIRAQRQRAR